MTTQGDIVYSALNATETTETAVGTINLPSAGVQRIVGIYGYLLQPLATSGETVSGYYRLSFKTVPGVFKFPTTNVAGAAALGVFQNAPQVIPVNIPVPPNETVVCYMAANKALTGTGEGVVGLIME
jgi:hypothetical protein